MSIPKVLSPDDYSVGWICALPSELAASKGMLDEVHGDLEDQDSSDSNIYVLGRIHEHNVAIASLSAGLHGTASAASVAKDMLRTFHSITLRLVVGTGGAAPSEENDIRLGDVVVSQPSGISGGVVQFDRGRTFQGGGFQRTGSLNSPPKLLLTALARLQAEHEMSGSMVSLYLSKMFDKYPNMKTEYGFPDIVEDCLYEAEYDHPDPKATCKKCDLRRQVIRAARDDNMPVFHYGNIASSSSTVEHGRTRQKLGAQFEVLCFENEGAASLMLDFPCLVIRGISDYSDSHKNKVWQKYAAATAAAYAKELLSFIPAARVRQDKAVRLVSDSELQDLASGIDASLRLHTERQEIGYGTVQHSGDPAVYQVRFNRIPEFD